MQSLDHAHHLFSSTISFCSFYAGHTFSPEDNHSADGHNDTFGSSKKTFQSAAISVFVILACFAERANCPCVSSSSDRDDLACGEAVLGNGARNSFAVFVHLSCFSSRHLCWL